MQVRHVKAGPLDLTLFTHSFLGLGQDAAQYEGLQLAKTKLKDDTEAVSEVILLSMDYESFLVVSWSIGGKDGGNKSQSHSGSHI